MFDLDKIFLISKVFTENILGNINPNCKCFTIAYPLSLHLENKGYRNIITNGYFINTPHYWLTLKQQRDTIIDPTIKQFCNNNDIVYLGNKSNNYSFIADEETNPSLIEDTYDFWLNPLICNDFLINEYLVINIRAAILLHNEMIAMNIEIDKSHKYFIYFKGINEIFKHSYNNVKKLEYIPGFDFLKIQLNNVFKHK